MSAVTILTSALQADSGAGSAVDVTAFSTLRLDWSVLADLGRDPQLSLVIESGPSAVGPFRTVYERAMAHQRPGSPYEWSHAPRAVLSGFDKFVRARWSGRINRTINEQSTNFFTIGLTGDGKPDAA